MKNSIFRADPPMTRIAAHALNVGDRINTQGFEKEALSPLPLALRAGKDGVVVVFRYGVVVFLNMTAEEEAAFLERLSPRIGGRRVPALQSSHAASATPFSELWKAKGTGKLTMRICRLRRRDFRSVVLAPSEEETAIVELMGEAEEQVAAGGPIQVRDMSMARLLVVSDVLAKSVVLAQDEREVAKVFETIEPFVRELATAGKFFRNRRGILRLIGEALLVQHNVSGRAAIADKPDALWDRPDLERLYARLEDEYELQQRVDVLNRKLAVVAETADTLADIIDTRRSLRLEIIIVLLIAFEIVIGFYQIFAARGGH
jgi:required for meiotic nuclear division protein 1